MRQRFLTRGDNNNVDDTELYPSDQGFLYRRGILGTVKGFVPYVGYIAIILCEYPLSRGAIIGTTALFLVFQHNI